MKICPRCGAEYPDSYLLCKEDGFPLHDGVVEAAIPSSEEALLVEEETTDLDLDEEPTNVVEELPDEDLVEEEPSRPGISGFHRDEDSLEPEKALPGAPVAEADEGPTDVVDHDEPTVVDQGAIESVLAKMKQEQEAEASIRSVPKRLPPVGRTEVPLSKPRPREPEAKLEKTRVKAPPKTNPEPMRSKPRVEPEPAPRRGPAPSAAAQPTPAERGDAEQDAPRPKTDVDTTRPVPSTSDDEVASLEEAPSPLPESPVAAPRAPSPLAAPPERQTSFGPASRLAAAAALAAEPRPRGSHLTAEVRYSYTPQPLGRKHLVLWGVSVVAAVLITAVVVWSLARSDNAAQERPALAAAALDAGQRVVAASAAKVANAAVVPNANVVPDLAVVRDSASAPDAVVPDAAAAPDKAALIRSRRRRRRARPRRTSPRRRARNRGRPHRVRPKPNKKDRVFQRTVDPFAE